MVGGYTFVVLELEVLFQCEEPSLCRYDFVEAISYPVEVVFLASVSRPSLTAKKDDSNANARGEPFQCRSE
jgi:hypothetical protein